MLVSSCQDLGILARIVHDFTGVCIAAVIRRLDRGNHLNITQAYKSALKQHDHVEDQAQLRVVGEMQKLQQQIMRDASLAGRLRRLLPGSIADRPRGIYLWGGVGRGKTFLMDLFFGSLNIRNKKRIHFHRMMRDIHSRLENLQDVSNPLDRVAADIAAESRVLCFDEFFVSDIGDAMILGRLLEGLFDRGVVLVTTSNARPEDLYKNGLQRARFLPAIELLEQHTQVIELDGDTDYRLQLLQEAGTFLTPAADAADIKLRHYFEEIASGDMVEKHVIDVLGRDVQTVRCAKGIAWFDFMDICDGPRSQEDYIEIARWYPTVIVSDMPVLDRELEDPARRFIAMVDEFYDRKVKLIISAAANIDALYQGNRLQFEFARTSSRLTEMQSREYLHAAHLA
jgi:cell division protein ZapE